MKPRIGIVPGDPSGIGPELTARLVASADVTDRAEITVIGDARMFEAGCEIAGLGNGAGQAASVLGAPPLDPATIDQGKVSLEGGAWQLNCLEYALNLVKDDKLDAVCFAPLNKEAMHLAGLKHEDEQGFIADVIGHAGPMGLINTVGHMWTSRVTSHVSHKKVSDLITIEGVLEAIRLADITMRGAGYEKPRLAVAGLNPHAGDGGNFGHEEIDTIAPAVEKAKAEGIEAHGPFPADTIFLRARNGDFDAVVTMYHDQGQIAMKLLDFDSGVTVHAGFPFPVATSAHGSAYDIAGKGVAKVDALRHAFFLLCDMVERQKS
ncbi:MAG: 4-hydroxythreonine-4-phosphate dehydrogenase PdxA [Rhodospirillales bacterium]|nr:4-hydroxythreonine-4-phosphate dehydrogenase PdxA [Alphaproteobacteria bacterium]MBL6929118.1 4-hydroxythreonine-4-phosphate dehydrogenase PdxA [Rhodospirillales bacterium]